MLRAAIADTPVVCVLGPHQPGKSTLVRTSLPEVAYVSFDDAATLALAEADPTGFVAAQPDPVILDEIQCVPELLRTIKFAVDRDRRPGRFVLTGSANLLLLPRLGDSLAGRLAIIHLQPLTAAEQARKPGGFLAAMLGGEIQPEVVGDAVPDVMALPARVINGGFPEPIARTAARARAWHRDYVRALVEHDVHEVAALKHADGVGRLLELLALRTAELFNASALSRDLNLRRETVDHYLSVLERVFLIRRLPAWHRNESKRLIKTPKIHVIDSGLAATLAGLTVEDWNTRRDRFGHLLESFVVQQLIAQAGWTDPDLRFWHYRDKDQVEVDLVITRGRQTWGVEVKAAATFGPADGHGLRRLADQCGKDFQGGVLLHAGTSTLPLGGPRLLGVPLARLWEM